MCCELNPSINTRAPNQIHNKLAFCLMEIFFFFFFLGGGGGGGGA